MVHFGSRNRPFSDFLDRFASRIEILTVLSVKKQLLLA